MVIDRVIFGGHLHGLFGTGHGSHTTSWQLIVDGLQRAVMNQPPIAAVPVVKAMLAAVVNLPGYAHHEDLVGRAAAEFAGAQNHAQQAQAAPAQRGRPR